MIDSIYVYLIKPEYTRPMIEIVVGQVLFMALVGLVLFVLSEWWSHA